MLSHERDKSLASSPLARCLGYSPTRLSPFSLFLRANERTSHGSTLGPCIYVPWLIYSRAYAFDKSRAGGRERRKTRDEKRGNAFSIRATKRCTRPTPLSTARRSCMRNAAATNENHPFKSRRVSDADVSARSGNSRLIFVPG